MFADWPPLWRHRHRYHGVLAPNSPLRAAAVVLGRDLSDDPSASAELAAPRRAPTPNARSPARYLYISVDPARIPAIREQQAQLAAVERDDSWIASRLRRLLRFDTTVNAHSIEVEAREGTVILSGAVTTSAEGKVAESLAADVPGVTDVDSRLFIERPR